MNLDKFFYPESIVFAGVSLSKITLGKIALLNNLKRGYKGRLYGVGSEEGILEGVPVLTSISALPETPDVACILTPAKTVPRLMIECGEKGIKHVVVETGGFSEFR
jgi:acetyltransferase